MVHPVASFVSVAYHPQPPATPDQQHYAQQLASLAAKIPYGKLRYGDAKTREDMEKGKAHAAITYALMLMIDPDGDIDIARELVYNAACMGDLSAVGLMPFMIMSSADSELDPDRLRQRMTRYHASAIKWMCSAFMILRDRVSKLRNFWNGDVEAIVDGDATTQPARSSTGRRVSLTPFNEEAEADGDGKSEVTTYRRQQMSEAARQASVEFVDSVLEDDDEPQAFEPWGGHKLQVVKGGMPKPQRDGKEMYEVAKAVRGAFDEQPLMGASATPERLREEVFVRMPWMSGAVEAIEADVMAMAEFGREGLTLKPTLLVGPPAAGKSYFWQQVAFALRLPHRTLNFGGVRDARVLLGTSRGWANTVASFPVRVVHETECANPLVVIEEIEKAGASHNGDPHSALLQILEQPGGLYYDEALCRNTDISRLSWVFTANSLAGIPDALLSRLRVVRVEGPKTRQEFDVLLDGLVYDLAGEHGRLGNEYAELIGRPTWAVVELSGAERDELWRAYRRGADVRTLKRVIERLAVVNAAEQRAMPN